MNYKFVDMSIYWKLIEALYQKGDEYFFEVNVQFEYSQGLLIDISRKLLQIKQGLSTASLEQLYRDLAAAPAHLLQHI